ncbi:hypothetical protein B0H13DRAFT_2373887 [Mycena leptocephala]|jgi:hypothetical protein|nr:hypothetical protein B0H13DRAFT_2373887 [Mycena leptocephala]
MHLSDFGWSFVDRDMFMRYLGGGVGHYRVPVPDDAAEDGDIPPEEDEPDPADDHDILRPDSEVPAQNDNESDDSDDKQTDEPEITIGDEEEEEQEEEQDSDDEGDPWEDSEEPDEENLGPEDGEDITDETTPAEFGYDEL